MDYTLHTLSNGLQVAVKSTTNTRIAHIGLFIDAGSRDELPTEVGMAHLLEHMLFKGTSHRNSHQVLNRLEVVGGDLNAFTTKDKTVIHASLVKDHFTRAVELLADVAFHSTFPEKELDKEKKVIYEEMEMYLDAPDERIFDDFQELLYPNHPLGNNILGTRETVEPFHSNNLHNFVDRVYGSNRMMLVVVAPISEKRMLNTVSRYFESVPLPNGKTERIMPGKVAPFDRVVATPFNQSHGLIGGHAYALDDDKRPALMLLSNMLGGPGLNALLNLDLREKRGYTYGVDCSYQALTDSGFFTIYWSGDPKNHRKSRRIILNRLDRLASTRISDAQLKKYKTQFNGQLVMAEESNSSLMFVIGRSLLDLGYVDSLNDVLEKINSISSEELRSVSEELFTSSNLSHLSFVPE